MNFTTQKLFHYISLFKLWRRLPFDVLHLEASGEHILFACSSKIHLKSIQATCFYDPTLNQCSVKGLLGQLSKSGKWGKAGDSRLRHKSDASKVISPVIQRARIGQPRCTAMRLDKSKLSGRPWMVAKGGSWFIWLTRTVMVTAGQSANSSHGYNWLHPSSWKFFLWREELPCRLMMVWWWCLTGSLSQDFKRTESWHFIFMARKNGRPIQVIRQQYHPFSWGRLPAACSDRNTETQCQCLQQSTSSTPHGHSWKMLKVNGGLQGLHEIPGTRSGMLMGVFFSIQHRWIMSSPPLLMPQL